jgi:hypothetical protein
VEGQDVAAKKRALGLLAAARDQDASDDASGGRPLDPLAALERKAHAAAVDGGRGHDDDDGDGGGGRGLELDPARAAQLAALATSADPDALSLDALTLDEQRAFLRAVAAGDATVSGAVAAAADGGEDDASGTPLTTTTSASPASWRPWWEASPEEHDARAARAAAGPLIQEVPATTTAVEPAAAASVDPAAFVCLHHPSSAAAAPPPFKALSPAAPPSPLLPVLLVDVLYAYAHTQRLYGGDWGADALGAAGVLLAVSQVLAADARPPSVEAALAGAMAAAVQPGVALASSATAGGSSSSVGTGVSYAVAADVAALLSGGAHYAADALAHARACVQAALAVLADDERGDGGDSGGRLTATEAKAASMARRRLTAASRKLLFYLAWAHDPAHAGPLALGLASTAAGVLGVVREHAALLAEGAAVRRQGAASRGDAGIKTRG